jgi:ComF family protein
VRWIPVEPEAPSSFERVREVLADTVWSWLFPARCAGCGRFETFLCDDCRALLTPVGPEQCPRCGNPGVGWTSPAWCPVCVGQEVAFLRARSAFLYEGVARHLVTAFKFQGQRSLAPVMAELADGAFADLVAPMSDPIVTWVPSHRATERARGYNQAEVLARGLAKRAGGLPAIALARKVSRTQHQQTLNRQSRRANLRGAFRPVGEGVTGRARDAKGVVVVDDVYTTGATANEVASVVAQGTGLPVCVFTFCRTVAVGNQGAD